LRDFAAAISSARQASALFKRLHTYNTMYYHKTFPQLGRPKAHHAPAVISCNSISQL